MAETLTSSTTPAPRGRPRPGRRGLVATAALAPVLLLTIAGCQSTKELLGSISPRFDESLSKGMVRPEDADSGRFLSRYLTPDKTPHASESKEKKSLNLGSAAFSPGKEAPNPKADAELDAASRLYRQGKYDEARPKLQKVVRDHKGDSWGKRAQFLIAESYYEQGKYVFAEDAYEQLVKDNPNSDLQNKVAARQYEIAQKFFAYAPDPKEKPEVKFPWTARFDGEVPLVDAGGFAIKALEHVRSNDPLGPLADDAVLKMADHYFSSRDYETAALYYDELVASDSKSEHLQRAQHSSIEAKLKSYLGPEYDGAPLEAARKTVKDTLTTFPDSQGSNEKLYQTLDLINDQFAERAYKVGMYYKETKHVASAEYYFGLVRARWPKTEWAEKSKVELATIAKLPRTETIPSKIMSQPGSTDAFGGGGQGGQNGGQGGLGGAMGGMGGMGMPG